MVAADGVAIYGSVVATLAFGAAVASLAWNISSSLRQRRERRSPDVHCSPVDDLTSGTGQRIEFTNAGPGLARNILYMYILSGVVEQGGVGTPFLGAGDVARVPLPANPPIGGFELVWAYMDADHNVHARSNRGDHFVYSHPTRVTLEEIFRRFYPSSTIPTYVPMPYYLGELPPR